MTPPTPHDIQAQIDALSERYAVYLSDDQLARFWSLYGRSLDAALIYLEQVCERPAGRTGPRINYVQRLFDNRYLPPAWDPCIDCNQPIDLRYKRCRPCWLLVDSERPAPPMLVCMVCRGPAIQRRRYCRKHFNEYQNRLRWQRQARQQGAAA